MALIMIGLGLSLVIITGATRTTLLQYLYLRFFGEREYWLRYVNMNKYIDSGHSIPIMEHYDFVNMQCDPNLKEKYAEFVAHNPYYFLIYNTINGPELCGYSTDSNEHIIFPPFYQKLCLKMARKMGYTYSDLYTMMNDGMTRYKVRRMERIRRMNDLEASLKELHERQKRLNEKTE